MYIALVVLHWNLININNLFETLTVFTVCLFSVWDFSC